MVELRQLKQILLLSEFKSFSKAAEMAHISQPSLSISIKKAEEYFGTKLFTRKSKSVELTAQGEVIAKMAKNMLETYSKGVEELNNIINVKTGLVKFGVDSFLSRKMIKDFIPQINKKYPGIRFELEIEPWYKLIEDLKNRTLDFIILVYSNKSDMPETEFTALEMFVPRAAYFTRKYHPLAKLKNIDSRKIGEFQWVGNSVSLTWAKWAMQATGVTEEGMRNIFHTRVNDYDKTIDLVQDNDTIGGHVYDEIKVFEEAGKVTILDINWTPPHPKNIGIITCLKNKHYSPACKLVVEEIQEYSKRWKE